MSATTQTRIYSIPQGWEDGKGKGWKNLAAAILLTHCRSEFSYKHGKGTLAFTQENPESNGLKKDQNKKMPW